MFYASFGLAVACRHLCTWAGYHCCELSCPDALRPAWRELQYFEQSIKLAIWHAMAHWALSGASLLHLNDTAMAQSRPLMRA